jgi:DENN domain-containing protein 5
MNIPTLEKSSSMTAGDSGTNAAVRTVAVKGAASEAPKSPTAVWDLSFLFGNGGETSDIASVASTDDTIFSQPSHAPLPERLVDFFCIVGPELDAIKDFAEKPKDVNLPPKLLDCYPTQRQNLDFPAELPMFCLPYGSTLSTDKRVPEIATFVLTSSSGNRLYGTVLTTYEVVPLEDLCEAFWQGECLLPAWLEQPVPFYLPKCLVIISHHAFFDVQRKFLSQLHRIALSGRSPLPLERYVANFVHDIPLPRPGLAKVSWHCFTKDTVVDYSRPASNELPLVNYSYRPIFRCLSISNILTLWAVLLQEGRVVLQSENQALLTPVAEALTSFLFPFTWQGVYVPVLPSKMLDILDAPVPFLVGFVGRQCPQPAGVVVCDLDQDIVHLGADDYNQSRMVPQLPRNLVGTLKAELEDVADSLYLIPPCGIMGRVTSAVHGLLENYHREPYANQAEVRELSLANTHRHFILSHANLLSRHQPVISSDFIAVGEDQTRYQTLEKDAKHKNRRPGGAFLSSLKRQTRAINRSTGGYLMGHRAAQRYDETMEKHKFSIASTLYDVDEDLADSVRFTFLRFFSTLLKGYKAFTRNGTFATVDFVESLTDLAYGNKLFVESMVKTQMFERFLVESSTRRRLFDEHVNIHLNENILAKKHETPFLDQQLPVLKIIEPAAPCFAGVRRGLVFEYENFPSKLRADSLVAHKNLDPVSALCYLGSDMICGAIPEW